MTRVLAATVLLVLVMGSTDRHQAAVFQHLMPLMVPFAVSLIADAGRRRPDIACRKRQDRARSAGR